MESLEFYSMREECQLFYENPLLNPLILDIIFQNDRFPLPSGNLAQLRSVCLAWRDYFATAWRNTAQLTLFLPQSPPRANNIKGKGMKSTANNKLYLTEFIELHSNNTEKLRSLAFRRYKLKAWNLDYCVGADINYLWYNVGPKMIRLELEECTSANIQPDLLFEIISEKTGNLEELCFNNCSFAQRTDLFGSRRYGAIVTNKLHLYQPNPSVSKLEIYGHLPHLLWDAPYLLPGVERIKIDDRDGVRYLTGILSLIESTQRPHRCSGLKVIDMIHLSSYNPPQGETYLLDKMTRAEFPLEELSIRVTFPPQATGFFLFRRILHSHYTTLRVLRIYQRLACELRFFPYQFSLDSELPSLEELSLHGFIATAHKFLRNASNLRKLYVDVDAYEFWNGGEIEEGDKRILSQRNQGEINWNEERKQEMFRDVEECNMRFLSYLHVDKMLSKGTLRSLHNCAPGLKTFHLVASNSRLKLISRCWPELVELKLLFGSRIDDIGIVGRIRDKLAVRRPVRMDQAGGVLEELLPASSLCSMKNLYTFSLDVECNKGKLTDESVAGFLGMTSLAFLDICVSPNMTVKAEQLLLERIVNARIRRNYGSCHDGECCRRKLFKDLIEEAQNTEFMEY